MGVIETTPTALALLILRNLVTPALIRAHESLVNLGEKYKLLEFVRSFFITCFLIFLSLLHSFLPSFDLIRDHNHLLISPKTENHALTYDGDSGIARALLQILSLINDIPVSSRKYELVRSLAEKLIEENQSGDVEVLRLANRTSLSAAFERTLSQLEGTMMELGYEPVVNGRVGLGYGQVRYQLNRVFRAVRSVKEGTLGALGGRPREGVKWSEKLAAELLWLSQKLAACGCGEEAVWRWASATNLAWFALSAEPRLQSSLVKVSAFLFKQAKDWGLEEIEGKQQQQRQIRKKMLVAWLPLLCKASTGTDVPVLSTSEKAELEKVLEELIGMMEQEEEQEQVLSLWLQHFTCCPSSDWPDLLPSYDRWCTTARRLLIPQ
ncbi:hypothetical protein GH714_007127 [Hevea brasiliensis]|uniref:Uncharacterized protein n=1 Tax=Hevea brasiliensis TaxID=3981 RepID=A0A6A6KZP7_HEVBR|nr:hypothetical protein GH714_007127 [Hevea brasiliensis]